MEKVTTDKKQKKMRVSDELALILKLYPEWGVAHVKIVMTDEERDVVLSPGEKYEEGGIYSVLEDGETLE